MDTEGEGEGEGQGRAGNMSYGRALVEPGEREVAGVGGPGRDGTVREQEVAGEEAGGDRDFMGEG